jgi:hypothetical protein
MKLYAFVFDGLDGKFWVCVMSMIYKTLGPYDTYAEAREIAKSLNGKDAEDFLTGKEAV